MYPALFLLRRGSRGDGRFVGRARPRRFESPVQLGGFLALFGKIVNTHPSAGIFFSYEGHPVTWFAFENADLSSGASEVNYFQSGLMSRFNVTPHFSTSQYAIVEVPQNGRLYSSPYVIGGLVLTFDLSKIWTIENTILIADGFRNADAKDLINRLQIKCSSAYGDGSVLNWNNSGYFDKIAFHAIGVMVSFPAFKVSKAVDLQASILYLHMLHRDDGITALNRGLTVTLSCPIYIR